MLRAALLLLILTNAAWRPRVVTCDRLEMNRYGDGSLQLVAWENRSAGYDWPVDWKTDPQGVVSGGMWFDDNGMVVRPREWSESVTRHNPERRAYGWHREHGETAVQAGIWHK